MTTTVVSSGRTLTGASVSGGDTIFVMSGGATVDTTLTGGPGYAKEYIEAGGVASDTQVGLLSQLIVSGGFAAGTVIDGGVCDVDLGGATSGTTFSGAGAEILSGGSATGTILGSGDSQRLIGGSAVGTKISNGGSQSVFHIGIASGTIVSSGRHRACAERRHPCRCQRAPRRQCHNILRKFAQWRDGRQRRQRRYR